VKNHIKKISQNLNSKFYFDFDMSKSVWLRAGGKAFIYCLVYNVNELKVILKEIGDFPFDVIGAGSNLLIRDSGFNGIIFKLGKEFNKINISERSVNVGAGILDTNLSKFAAKNNIKNFEFYSGIPGSIGGAIKMNAGCYGFETKDVIKEIKFINNKGELINYSKDQINFDYRKSNFPENSIIISAKFDCLYGNKEEIHSNIKNIKKIRENSQPIKSKTSGSTFKNPKNNIAAKLIEQSGCKGLQVGDVIVSEKHANFLINLNKASASEIEDLGSMIIEKVYDKFNIKLEWEIKIIG